MKRESQAHIPVAVGFYKKGPSHNCYFGFSVSFHFMTIRPPSCLQGPSEADSVQLEHHLALSSGGICMCCVNKLLKAALSCSGWK